MYLQELSNGSLKITLDDDSYEGLFLLKDTKKYFLSEIPIMQKLMDMFLKFPNDSWHIVKGRDIGMKTEAPVIFEDSAYEEGDYITFDDYLKGWYFPDYKTIDFTDVLFDKGEVIFPQITEYK